MALTALSTTARAGGPSGGAREAHIAATATHGGPAGPTSAPADEQGLKRVGHIVVLMQENHSFDSYLGVLPYMPGSPYHPPAEVGGPCDAGDHLCVGGLSCSMIDGRLGCTNSNPALRGTAAVRAFHQRKYCTSNPHHGWVAAHREANYADPNSTAALNDGFVRANGGDPTTMGYYTRADLPYYYALASTFAMSDRQFSALIGPTLPNRMYLMAATSFGHLESDFIDNTPPSSAGYKPISPTIFDLLDRHHVPWTEYFQPGNRMTPPRPYGRLFRNPASAKFLPLRDFVAAAAADRLAPVVFIDLAQHEHPPLDVRRGEFEVARVVGALRRSPAWANSVLIITYDENGGFYDHVAPPAATSPDGIPPGACADLSNPPSSEQPGGGAHCLPSRLAQSELCRMASPGKPCADFTQDGFRVPLIVVSPFARPHYVSHVARDHTAILRLIEDRLLGGQRLTARDAAQAPFDEMLNFADTPSAAANVAPSIAPAPRKTDPGC
jgi:phospholipase C